MNNQDFKNDDKPRNFFAEWNAREKNEGFNEEKRDLPAFAIDAISKGLNLVRSSRG